MRATRKTLIPVAALLLFAACETKTPAGPTALPTTTTTTTTTIAPTPTTTTSSSTTTTIVLASLARRYVAFNPPANQPSEMTLFFELLTPAGGGSAVSTLTSMLFGGPQTAQEAENRYRVTGVYIMPNGTTGGITGTLGGASNPLDLGGTFTGMFTAKTPTGCTAERPFAGKLNPQTLQLSGTEPGTSTCSPSPLAIPAIEMLRSDPAAPVPTPPSTTSVSTTTTTSIACSYTVSPLTHSVESGGGPQSVTITAPAGCAWSAQSFADWLIVRPPFGGAGSSTVTFDVQPNATGAARSGTLLIAGAQVVVSQPVATACSYSVSPLSHTLESGAGAASVSITAPAGCAWSAQTFADWILVRPPSNGTGPGTVTFDVAANATASARSGSLTVAGVPVTVTQNAPRPDLAPDAPLATSCALAPPSPSTEGPVYQATLIVRNIGIGTAGPSQTRIEMHNAELNAIDVFTRDAPQLVGGASVTHVVNVPFDCWRVVSETSTTYTEECPITVIADYLQQVTEVTDANNSASGACRRTLSFINGAIRPGAGQ